MSTHNVCFRGEIRKIFTGYPSLSRPMGLLGARDYWVSSADDPFFFSD